MNEQQTIDISKVTILSERPSHMDYETYKRIKNTQNKIIKHYLKGKNIYPAYIEIYYAVPEDKRFKTAGPFTSEDEADRKIKEKPKAKYKKESKYISQGPMVKNN